MMRPLTALMEYCASGKDVLEECGESGEGASVNAYRILRNWGCNMDQRPQAGGPYCTPNFEE